MFVGTAQPAVRLWIQLLSFFDVVKSALILDE